jgi:hypothetical protein
MKNIIFIAFSALLFTSCAITNVPSLINPKYDAYYASTIEPNTKLINTGYIHTLVKDKNEHFILSTFYPDTKMLTRRVEFSDNTLLTPVGKYVEKHWETGKILVEGQFNPFGKKTGLWKKYSAKTGNLILQQSLFNGEINDVEFHYIDTTIERMVAYKVYYSDNKTNDPKIIYEEYPSAEGNKIFNHGIWIKPDTIPEVYKFASYYSPICADDKDEKAKNRCETNEMFRYVSKKMNNFNDIINKGIRDIEILVEFTVLADSTVTRPMILKAMDAKENEKILNLFASMPKWNPATLNGKPINSQLFLPLTIRLKRETQY